jgi:hypothetical protein
MFIPDRLRLDARRAWQLARALVAQVRSRVSSLRRRPRQNDAGYDEVDEASQESFPASDPPTWTGMHAGSAMRDKPDSPGKR